MFAKAGIQKSQLSLGNVYFNSNSQRAKDPSLSKNSARDHKPRSLPKLKDVNSSVEHSI